MQNMALVAQTCAGIEPNYVLQKIHEKMNMNSLARGMFEQPQDFIKDAQSFKSQEIRVKLKRMYFVVRPCKPTKN